MNMTNTNNNTTKLNPITEGPVLPSFINFAFPLMLTSLMMQSYTIADGLILGNLVNERALGAVNSISPIIDLLGLIQIGLSGKTDEDLLKIIMTKQIGI